MKDKVFTVQQLQLIQQHMKEFICFVEKYDNELPHCFDSCKRIVKNIDICKNENYADIDYLTEYLRQDWKDAMLPRCGLKDYYISNDNFENQKNINFRISEFIDAIDKCINI